MRISREKAALGVAVALALAGLGVLLAYIFTVGHSLNVAASSIDDATGSLDGYTVLLCEGTAEDQRETVVDTSTLEGGVSSRLLNKQSSPLGAPDDEVSADEAAPGSSGEDQDARPVSLPALAKSYVDAQAKVIVVDVVDLGAYNERYIVRAAGRTYGFVSIDEVTAQGGYFHKRVADYRDLGVDIVVCVVSDISLLDDYEGADIVISTQDEGLSSGGALVDGSFYMDAALKGRVGTVLVSPSRTITAKDAVAL